MGFLTLFLQTKNNLLRQKAITLNFSVISCDVTQMSIQEIFWFSLAINTLFNQQMSKHQHQIFHQLVDFALFIWQMKYGKHAANVFTFQYENLLIHGSVTWKATMMKEEEEEWMAPYMYSRMRSRSKTILHYVYAGSRAGEGFKVRKSQNVGCSLLPLIFHNSPSSLSLHMAMLPFCEWMFMC